MSFGVGDVSPKNCEPTALLILKSGTDRKVTLTKHTHRKTQYPKIKD
jgi:hypothetical protein